MCVCFISLIYYMYVREKIYCKPARHSKTAMPVPAMDVKERQGRRDEKSLPFSFFLPFFPMLPPLSFSGSYPLSFSSQQCTVGGPNGEGLIFGTLP